MNYKEILVTNPITHKSIDKLFDEINLCSAFYLLINIGAHNFESIEVLKELKNRFFYERENLSRFKKVAFIHPVEYRNESQDVDKYNFFSDRQEAINWLNYHEN